MTLTTENISESSTKIVWEFEKKGDIYVDERRCVIFNYFFLFRLYLRNAWLCKVFNQL